VWKEPFLKTFNCKFLLIWLLVLGICPFFGPAASCFAEADQKIAAKEDRKIRITSQRLISDQAKNQAEFIGKVRAVQGETSIFADSLTIFFSSTAKGDDTSPAQSINKLVASGNVEIKFDNRLAVARQAVYITAQRVLILKGPEARVTSGENTIRGETITFYREDGRFTVEGGENGRVTAVILPDKAGLE
jgi:lipopolysaccharide export system protein LptA